jgi:hypothetical protein
VEYMKELLCEVDTAQHLSISEADINEAEGHSLKKEKEKEKERKRQRQRQRQREKEKTKSLVLCWLCSFPGSSTSRDIQTLIQLSGFCLPTPNVHASLQPKETAPAISSQGSASELDASDMPKEQRANLAQGG